jgi:DNA polymerase-3 subunit gamma/tau
MLTDSAFNALLKTLEEPPEYVVFILATTEINELPPTIISRCIRFDFSRIDSEAIKKRIEFVANEENIPLGQGASDLIARLADGAMRDALSLLEACSNGLNGELTPEAIRGVLGLASNDMLYSLLRAIYKKDIPAGIDIVEQIHRSSKDISVFIDDLAITVRDIMIEKQLHKSVSHSVNTDIPQDLIEQLTLEQLFYIISVLEETQSRISRYTMNKRIVLEMAVIRMCDRSISDTPKALAARISELEKKIALLSAKGFVAGETTSFAAPPLVRAENPATENDIDRSVERSLYPEISEVYEYLSDQGQIKAFLKQTKVFIQDNNIIIVADDLQKNMLDNADSRRYLSDAFTSVSGCPVSISFESAKRDTNSNQTTLIDEL